MKELKVIKEDEYKKITLLYDEETDKKYIQKRIFDDKRDVYKTIQKINHPNIPRIINVEFDGDTVVTEEYAEGKKLSELMDGNVSISKKKVKSIIKQLLSAMSELHNAKIIHRDIKPDNIIVDEIGNICLIDYDIARIYREELRRDTELKGTFGYAPIEQYGMLPTDYKTDIYAFGITLKKLLDYTNIKYGVLNKIAKKCTRLDPSQRYSNAKAIQKTLNTEYVKYLIICTALITAVLISLTVKNKLNANNTDITQEYKEVTDLDADTDGKTEEQKEDSIAFDGSFWGFEDSAKEKEYSNYSAFSDVVIFKMDQPYEHLLFLEDENKKGKIRFGINNSVIEADITLNNGRLSVSLNDENNNRFDKDFCFNNQYEYDENYTEDIRKNADIICYDFDADGYDELLVGLNDGLFKIKDKYVYNNLNYCIAWCIKYDDNGFALCEGDMFSKGYSFTINSYVKKVNVYWDNFGEPTGYILEDNEIKTVF